MEVHVALIDRTEPSGSGHITRGPLLVAPARDGEKEMALVGRDDVPCRTRAATLDKRDERPGLTSSARRNG
jgi:hypothetical protein